jgi:hypothetical protein
MLRHSNVRNNDASYVCARTTSGIKTFPVATIPSTAIAVRIETIIVVFLS